MRYILDGELSFTCYCELARFVLLTIMHVHALLLSLFSGTLGVSVVGGSFLYSSVECSRQKNESQVYLTCF